ncbi:hypothetical protein BJY16_005859 [Actinoplanes octamycinicus]|uniref:Uncharacterized protein n=1 Tax=Actinoplanes octamycinicus TaxID=135948 RepID=A0A7W7H1R4_9ACTN|nr:hypothetical protein [Actinoplanes octamycinicus]MBB4742400.1 hypothetical protein [Actinoplanes octamycinicus]GIE62350.1 hypothetical protein Aoc01nite_77520 [Actinoplanes octamycinicus]
MSRPVRSKAFDDYCRTMMCPRGHRRSITFIEGSGAEITDLSVRDRALLENPTARFAGQPVPGFLRRLRRLGDDVLGGVTVTRFRSDSVIACGPCGEEWPVFVPALGGAVQVRRERAVRIETTPLGEEVSTIDHSAVPVDSTVSVQISCGWTKSIEIEWGRTTTRTGTVRVGASHGALSLSLQRQVQESLNERHKISTQQAQTYATSVEVRVPAHAVAEVVTRWKQRWRVIEYDLWVPEGEEVTVVCRLADGPSYDSALRFR